MLLSKITSDDLELRHLIRKSQTQFEASGWKIDESASSRCHFKVDKGQFTFFITCLEQTTSRFYNPSRLFFLFQEDTGFFRAAADRLLVFILGPGFPPFCYSTAAETGLSLVPIADMELVTTIDTHIDQPGDLTPRQELLVCANRQVCLNIADTLWKSGNPHSARKWAEIAASGNRPFVYATKKFIEILLELEDVDKARSIALDAVHDEVHAALFLPIMVRISSLENNQGEVDYWTNRLAASRAANTNPSAAKKWYF